MHLKKQYMKQLLQCLSIILPFTLSSQIKIDDVGEGWKNSIEQALCLIEHVDSAKYQQVITTCNHIGFWNGSYSTTEDSTILISNREARYGNITDLAAALVHESMHLYIIQQRQILTPEEEETVCYLYELDFLVKVPGVESWLIQHVLRQLEALNK
jgi:hypothetical protein